MLDLFKTALADGPEVPFLTLLIRLVVALGAGAVVAAMFERTRSESGTTSLPATLVLLSVLIAAVTQVIGDNVARAFSLVGALSIVRFRTVVRDTRDTAFVIFAVVVGMGVGAGHVKVALTTLAVGGLGAWLMRARRGGHVEAPELELTVRVGLGQDAEAMAAEVFQYHLLSREGLGASTARQGAALEVTWKVSLKPGSSPAEVVRALNRIEGIQNVELRPRENRG